MDFRELLNTSIHICIYSSGEATYAGEYLRAGFSSDATYIKVMLSVSVRSTALEYSAD